jgi:hypothetical protein
MNRWTVNRGRWTVALLALVLILPTLGCQSAVVIEDDPFTRLQTAAGDLGRLIPLCEFVHLKEIRPGIRTVVALPGDPPDPRIDELLEKSVGHTMSSLLNADFQLERLVSDDINDARRLVVTDQIVILLGHADHQRFRYPFLREGSDWKLLALLLEESDGTVSLRIFPGFQTGSVVDSNGNPIDLPLETWLETGF